MELFWEKLAIALLKWDPISILLTVLLIIFSLILLFLLFFALTHIVDVSFKFLTGSCFCLENIKLVLKYKSFLGKALLWKLKILNNLDKKKEEAKIIEQISQARILVINGGSDHGMRDVIMLRELEKMIKMLPATLIDFTSSHPAGPFVLAIVEDAGTDHWGKPTLMRYNQRTNQCQVAKKNTLLLKGYRAGIVHEIGHAFEVVFNQEEPVKFKYFKEWILFIDGFEEPPPSEYARDNHWNEDFAETFKLYFVKPDYLKEKCPLRYGKLEEILQQANIKR